MKLEEILIRYPECRIAYRHNPKHFYQNSFQVEKIGGRRLIVARVKRRCNKRFRIVGILKVKK